MNEFNIRETDAAKFATEEEIRRTGGIIFDPEAHVDREAPVNLPDVDEMIKSVEEVLEYMCTDEMIKLKEEDDTEYLVQMEQKFPYMSDRHYSLFQQVINGEDITYFFKMLDGIDRVKRGEVSIEDMETMLGEELRRDFVKEDAEVKVAEDNSDFDIDISDEEPVNNTAKKKKKRKKKKKAKVVDKNVVETTQ